MIPVKVLSVSTRPSGHTHVTWRAPDGRRLQWVFAPGEYAEAGLEATRRYIEAKRRQEDRSDSHV